MTTPDDARYAALSARDARFDGVFFVGVTTTGIYCRPVCTARTPGRPRCRFYATAALAEQAGFRACFRCRPEIAPGQSLDSSVDAVPRLVARAVGRIEAGALASGSLETLADELVVTSRHLRRVLVRTLGVSPVELAQTRRLGLAKQLIRDSRLGFAAIAFAAGFGSVRRMNASFSERMGRAPSTLPRGARDLTTAPIRLLLDARPPFDWPRLLAFLSPRAIPRVECIRDGRLERVVSIDGHAGIITIERATGRAGITLSVDAELLPVLMPLVARVRRLCDLDAHPAAIADALGRDPRLGRLVRARPGLRVPGAIDGFETGVRTLLGQQVSVAGATTLTGRFAERFGTPLDGEWTRFPTAAEVARRRPADIAAIGLPRARAESLLAFARAVAAGTIDLDSTHVDIDAWTRALVAIPGIGPWTAAVLAMRALHHPDAFPAGDLGVRKALALTETLAARRAEAWRPWRSSAVMHLWTELAERPRS